MTILHEKKIVLRLILLMIIIALLYFYFSKWRNVVYYPTYSTCAGSPSVIFGSPYLTDGELTRTVRMLEHLEIKYERKQYNTLLIPARVQYDGNFMMNFTRMVNNLPALQQSFPEFSGINEDELGESKPPYIPGCGHKKEMEKQRREQLKMMKD